jgi:hypothetical protein
MRSRARVLHPAPASGNTLIAFTLALAVRFNKFPFLVGMGFDPYAVRPILAAVYFQIITLFDFRSRHQGARHEKAHSNNHKFFHHPIPPYN